MKLFFCFSIRPTDPISGNAFDAKRKKKRGWPEVAEVEDGVVILDCGAIFNEEGEGGEHYRNKNKFRCRISRIEKRLVKLKKKKIGKFAFHRRGV